VAAAAGLSAVVALSGTATAESAPAGGFVSQAKALGLNAAEAKTLQSRVDSYIVKTGGTQIAADRIQLGEGAVLTLALPTTAGGDQSSASRAASYTCRYGHFCAYSDTYWSGDVIDMYQCASYKIPWFGDGSWINNQTSGTQAAFRDNEFVVRWVDSGAYSSDDVADWTWVHYVTNC
jgi:hypothetical protein